MGAGDNKTSQPSVEGGEGVGGPASSASATVPGAAAQQQGVSPEVAFAIAAGNAEKGDGLAMVTLGGYYEQGIGVSRNFIKALEWFQKAADAGVPQGWYNVGICYEVGMGTSGDPAKALSCFERAAAMGLPEAMVKLAMMYLNGEGAARNESRGMAYLSQAADAGVGSAADQLGLIYLQGLIGQGRDERRAYGYFARGAEVGYVEAIVHLGIVHRDGLGVSKDEKQALKWFTIALKGGYQSEELAQAVSQLKGSLGAMQSQVVEREADQWLQAYGERTGMR